MRTHGTRYPLLKPRFDPRRVSGLALWLRADHGLYQERTGASATTPAAADSDPVGTWLDCSGRDNHPLAASDATRPTMKVAVQNGLPAVKFDGADDLLATASNIGISGDAAFTVSAVVVATRTTTAEVFWMFGNGSVAASATSLGSAITASGKIDAAFAGVQNYRSDLDGVAAAAVYTVSKTPGGISTTTRVFKNGIQGGDRGGSSASTPNIAASPFRLGGFVAGGTILPTTAYLGEVLVYGVSLTGADRRAVESYLNSRWGVF